MMKRMYCCWLLLLSCAGALADQGDELSAAGHAAFNAKEYAKSAALHRRAAEFDARRANSAYNAATAYVMAGDHELGWQFLQKALDVGRTDAEGMVRDQALLALHADPRWPALLQRAHEVDKQFNALYRSPALATPYAAILTRDEQVAGLAKLWSEVKYNFLHELPLKRLDWDAQLLRYLPQLQAGATTAQYYRILSDMLRQLGDPDTGIALPAELLDAQRAAPPLRARLIEGRVIVNEVLSAQLHAQGIVPGVEVLTQNGQDALAQALAARDRWQYHRAGEADKVYATVHDLLRGPVDEPVQVGFALADGRRLELPVSRLTHAEHNRRSSKAEATELNMHAGGIAHLRIDVFDDGALRKVLRRHAENLKQARALVIDLRDNDRDGSDAAMKDLAACLLAKPFTMSPYISRENDPLIRVWNDNTLAKASLEELTEPNAACAFRKPVYVLTSLRTRHGEQFLATLLRYQRVTTVGERSGGGLRQLTVTLPGNGRAWIGSVALAAPDFSPALSGIEAQIKVQQTVADFRQGIDTVLQAALAAARRHP